MSRIISGNYRSLPPLYNKNDVWYFPMESLILPDLPKPEVDRSIQTYSSSAEDRGFTHTGQSGNMTWIIQCSGHGNDQYINWLRKEVDWKSVAEHVNPVQHLQALYKSSAIYRRSVDALESGASFAMARILETPETRECLVECTSIGDSSILVFVNGGLMYMNRGHTAENPDEIERLSSMSQKRQIHYRVQQTTTPKVLSSTEITTVPSFQTQFQCKVDGQWNIVSLAQTQALGHLGVTGIKPEKHLEHCYKGDKIRVVVGSKGLMQMLSASMDNLGYFTAEELGLLATERWEQKWSFVHSKFRVVLKKDISLEPRTNDISLALWENDEALKKENL